MSPSFIFSISFSRKLYPSSNDSHELGREANQGINFSWTKSGLSSWGQCPTPSNIKKLTLGCREGKEAKYLPTGPSRGVNGSWFPHRTRIGKEILGINCTGLGPGGPVTMETKASRAPASSAGSLMICSFQVEMNYNLKFTRSTTALTGAWS